MQHGTRESELLKEILLQKFYVLYDLRSGLLTQTPGKTYRYTKKISFTERIKSDSKKNTLKFTKKVYHILAFSIFSISDPNILIIWTLKF
jgi:hypothetical protein